MRLDVEIPSGQDTLAAWLYLPDLPETAPTPPVIVMAHGLGGIRQMRLDAYAERFTAAGYAALAFDYRHFGASTGEPRQLLDVKLQLADWATAIAYARSRPEVDPDRVVLWGTSFGGGHVIATGARDTRVAAVIAQCPFTDGLASGLAMDPLTSVKIGARAARDVIAARLGKAPVMVSTAGPLHSAALMATADAVPGYLALVDAEARAAGFDNQVAARVVFDILRHRPGRQAKRVRCPILFNICETDSVAPAKATLRHARTAPRVEIRLYPEGHFDIYLGEAFERVVADQLEFLTRHIPTTQPRTATS
ncbi:alpha/beta hydrolase [Skermania piniformis]|uniref:Alpha/beta hydrolase n=1 Tax=Skermania pinensis TaxID=39122 RepID=A0ABX8SCA8_9ACTN|nr:alpha/beta fold hydrolase [Skermania piniformis]QXQ15509.1 alpha/beta hydrolase [Skermania piniformis]